MEGHIQLRELNYRYKDSRAWSLQDFSFSIVKGELVVIAGRSGCGKSTLFRCINGLCPHFYEGEMAGSVNLNGEDIAPLRICDISKIAASVFQNPESQFFTTDVLSELVYACENYGISRDEMEKRLGRIVHALSLGHLLDRKLSELSGGEKQKVAIASTLMLGSEVLLLDEPSSNLDFQSIALLKETLSGLKSSGYTILVIEHRLYYLDDICDRLAVIEGGRLLTVYERPSLRAAGNAEFNRQGLRGLHLFQNAALLPEKREKSPLLLVLEGLWFAYEKGIDVLKDLSLSVHAGDRIALLGKNGCGKTTLGKVLCGLRKEQGGRILLNGRELTEKRRSAAASYVMQNVDFQLFGCSVYDDLLLGNERIPDIERRIHVILSELGLSELEAQHPVSLSMGQKQRLVVASSYLLNKRINVFDEPTSGLDWESMKSVCSLIVSVTGKENASIVITHDYEFVLSSCNRVVLMENGRIAKDFYLDGTAELERIFRTDL